MLRTLLRKGYTPGSLVCLLALLVMTLTACGGSSTTASSGAPVTADAITTNSGTIAVLLQATAASPRWETQDRPRLIAGLKKYAPNATVTYANAEGSEDTQLSQAEAAISAGAKVLLVAPVDGVAAGAIARKAHAAGVAVIAYDALVLDAPVDYYVSFNNVRVGELMGEYIRDHTKQGDTIGMIGGSPQDNNAILFEQGALNILQPLYNNGSRILGFRTLTPDWKAENAQREMEQGLSKVSNHIAGVVVGNDNLATGVIAALNEQGLAGKVLVTGQDATAVGLQHIVEGQQGMTVYKPIAQEADAAAKLAAYLLGGKTPPAGFVNGSVDNHAGKVPSVLLTPISVTIANISTTVIADKFVTWDTICQGATVTCPPK